MSISIKYTDVYVPEDSYPVEDYVNQLDVSSINSTLTKEEIAGVLKYAMGIEKVYLGDRKNEADSFAVLMGKYFQETGTKPEDVDYIIYTRGNSVAVGDPWGLGDDLCINVPYYIQNKFEMTNAQVFSIEQECAGTMIALKLANALSASGSNTGKILILSGNYFETPEKRLMGGMIVVSDGVGMMEVSEGDSGLEIVDYISKTDGRISKVKDLSSPENTEFVVETGCEIIRRILSRNKLDLNMIAQIVPQNISKNIWNLYCRTLDFPKEKVFLENIRDGGHMGDVDIIRNLTAIRKKEILKPGDYALVYGLGTGTSWNVLLVKAH